MTYICFAAGPLHLICIKEFLYQKKIRKYVIYLISPTDHYRINLQMKKTIKFLNLRSCKKVYFSKFKIINYLQRYFFVFSLIRQYKKKNISFLILDFRNTFMHFLRIFFKKSKFILIDDGTQTVFSYKKYIEKKIYLPVDQYKNFFGKFNKLIHFGFKFRRLLYSKIEIFSIYANDLSLSENSFNKLSYICGLSKKRKLKYSNSLVYFSGTKLAERGALTLDQELKIINKIKIYWEKRKKKLVYFAKRTSSLNKLEIIRKKLSLQTIVSDLPLELELMINYKKKLPKYFCSLGSTTNKTISMIYKKIKIYTFSLDGVKIKNQ